jgi:hypothetical protein
LSATHEEGEVMGEATVKRVVIMGVVMMEGHGWMIAGQFKLRVRTR